MRFLFTAVLFTFLMGCDTPSPSTVASNETSTEVTGGHAIPEGFKAAQDTIGARGMYADVSIIAGDQFEGRGAGTEGDRKARSFLANRLTEMGYEPFFEDGSFEQPVEIIGLTVQNPSDLLLTSKNDTSVSFSFGGRHYVGFDAVSYGIAVPEPSTLILTTLLIGILAAYRFGSRAGTYRPRERGRS